MENKMRRRRGMGTMLRRMKVTKMSKRTKKKTRRRRRRMAPPVTMIGTSVKCRAW
jgi:hypothetical protein